MNPSTIPGIVKIQIVDCLLVRPYLMLSAMTAVVPALAVVASEVKFFGTPTLKWEATLVNGSPREKATLEFSTTAELPRSRRLAFVVTLASGQQYIIGTREPKYPQITFSETTGTPGGDPHVRTYKITYVAQKAVLPCVL